MASIMALLAGVAVVFGVWRGVATLMRRPRTAEGLVAPFSISPESWITAAVVIVAIVACIGLGLFPQLLAPVAASLAEGYTFFLN
jgi:hypothetical protein